MLMKMKNVVFGEKPFAKQRFWYVDEDAKHHFWREALRKTTNCGMLMQMKSIIFGEKLFAKQRFWYVDENAKHRFW